MKRNTKRFLSLFLSVPVAVSLVATPVSATPQESTGVESGEVEENLPAPAEEATRIDENAEDNSTSAETEDEAQTNTNETVSDEENAAANNETTDEEAVTGGNTAENFEVVVKDAFTAFTLDTSAIEVPEVNVNERKVEGVEIDESNPEIAVVKKELENIKVLNDDGVSVALSDEQIARVLEMFQKYTEQWKANADILGVQTPFYLMFNDNKEDGLGVLGEMLTLAGVEVEDVRTGNYSYDDLCGMIMNFQFGDQYGIQFYGDTIRAKRDEALAAVKASGAQTEVQKLLVLNDWMAQTSTFDMAYIMNQMDKEEPAMVAPSPEKHPHYDEVYAGMKTVYESQIQEQFYDQFYGIVEDAARQDAYKAAIENIVIESQKAEGKTQEEAADAAKEYITANEETITADAYQFIVSNFGQEAADGVKAEIDEQLESEKVKGDLKAATQDLMNRTDLPDMNGMSPNQMIPIYADQAAQGLTEGIIGYWSGNHMGALAEGKAVCMGYAKAYAYLVQCMYPEYYGVNGAGTDMTVAENWKEPKDLYYDEDGNLDVNQNYNVDLVRITFQADVTMYGESQADFNSDHFWNAVKIDGEWYYVDPCYTDVWSEVMDRDRVETDGYINHLYFMMSHTSASTMFDGNYKVIKGLYNDVADNQQYEDTWVSRIASTAYSDGQYFYYLYDSTDLLSMLEDFNNSNGDYSDLASEDAEYKIVRHAITGNDVGDGDTDYEALIDFTYKPSEDAESVVRVLDPASKEMKENEMLTELYKQFVAEQNVYPSLHITPVLYGNKIYFNLSNCILSYDLASGEVAEVKEYNTVHAVRDDSVAFGGMAFSAAGSAEGADFTFENHPIAGMTLKRDNQLYVDIATNLAYISGKDPHNYADTTKFGWEFEESNYNSNYQSYMQDAMKDQGVSDDMLEQMGYKKEINDNDEFMWVANVVETMDMAHFAGGSHSYSEVSIDPFCERDGYTEKRCETCGVIENGSRVVDEDSAHDNHHYIKFDEEYYTKDEAGNWNTGTSYVCAECGFSISEPSEPKKNSQETDEEYEERAEEYEELKAIYDEAVATAGHVYEATDAQWSEDGTSVTFSNLVCASVCAERKDHLDCLVNDDTISASLSAAVTANAEITEAEGTCAEGVSSTYTASGESEGYKYEVSMTKDWPAGEHNFVNGKCVKCGEADPSAIAVPEIESVYSKNPTTVKVTWNKVEGAVGYQLWRAESADATEWTLAKTIDSSQIDKYTKDDTIQYTNVDLEVGKTYYYKLRAYALKSGAEDEKDEASRIYSEYSAVDYMPAAVVWNEEIGVYSAAPNKIRLNWMEVNGANGYQIWRKGEDGSYSVAKTLGDRGNELTDDQGKTTAYSNVDLEAGETYTYKIRAFRIPGDGTKVFGAYSEEFTLTTMPEKTALKGASSKAEKADLTWDEVNGAAGYQIWMSESDGEYKIVKTIEKGSTTSYTKSGLQSGAVYKFKIRAYTESNGKKTFGADSDEISVKVK